MYNVQVQVYCGSYPNRVRLIRDIVMPHPLGLTLRFSDDDQFNLVAKEVDWEVHKNRFVVYYFTHWSPVLFEKVGFVKEEGYKDK